jgi:hypothetical protein
MGLGGGAQRAENLAAGSGVHRSGFKAGVNGQN